MMKKLFTPSRPVFQHPPEGTRVVDSSQEAAKRAPEKADAQKVSEAAIIYKSNYRNLVSQVDKYAESNNPRIAEIAKKYRDMLNAGIVDPNTVDALLPDAQQENIKKVSAIIIEFSKEVRKASIEGARASKPEEKRREGNAPEWLAREVEGQRDERVAEAEEKPETLDQAYKRYQMVFNANAGVIKQWSDEINSGKLAASDKDAASSELEAHGKKMTELFGGLTIDMFKDPSGVDRVIAAINDYMNKNVEPFYTDLTKKHREIMAERSKDKQNKTV